MDNSQNFNKKSKETDYLSAYKKNVASQFGEDGIIEKIFSIIKDGDKWCIEFGAWDGKLNSNTCNLIQNKGWAGIVIEAGIKKYEELVQNYKDNSKVICINKFVNFDGPDTLDDILGKTPVPNAFDLLSIDIDGNDYYVWESLRRYRPKVVIIEFNPSIPINVEFTQPRDMKISQGSSLLSLNMLAKKKDYELIAITDINAFFVEKKYFELFEIEDNDLSLFHKNTSTETQLFQLYDGTLVLSGCKYLIWHGIELNQEKIQVLPKFLRRAQGVSERFSLTYRLLLRFYSGKSLKAVFLGIMTSIVTRIKSFIR